MATVWIKICVNCIFNDNRVICYIKTQLKYPKSLRAILRRFLISIKMFFLESPHLITLGSRGYFFLIDTAGSRRSRVNEEKNNLWSQEYATSFPCGKSVQDLNWVTDWILPCPQGINNIIMALIGYIEQLDMEVSNQNPELISHMEMRLRTLVTRGYFFPG